MVIFGSKERKTLVNELVTEVYLILCLVEIIFLHTSMNILS